MSLITKEQLKEVQEKLKKYDPKWAASLEARLQKKYNKEPTPYTKRMIWNTFCGPFNNPLVMTRFFNEANIYLAELIEEYDKLTKT